LEHGHSMGKAEVFKCYGCPTFLLTQQQWKIFVENPARNKILTYPFSRDTSLSEYKRSIDLAPINDDLIRAITICLLSSRGEAAKDQSISSYDEALGTMQETEKNLSRGNEIEDFIQPTFISGYTYKGDPIYSVIRVYSEEECEAIEAEIENIAPRLY
jgi:hypothetical protein